MKWIEVPFGGKTLRVPAMKFQGKLWFHWLGETHAVELPGANRRNSGEAGKTHPGVIAAPMPGKVTRVSAKKGEPVRKGQALVVMEAMKMEYTLEADLDGRVSEVHVKPGAQVGLGEILVRLVDA